jgi:hypothetical protein
MHVSNSVVVTLGCKVLGVHSLMLSWRESPEVRSTGYGVQIRIHSLPLALASSIAMLSRLDELRGGSLSREFRHLKKAVKDDGRLLRSLFVDEKA